MKAINPATEELIRDYPEHDPAQVEAALRTAQGAFEEWRGRSFAQRSRLMKRAAAQLRRRKSEFAALMTREMGKPISGVKAEVEKCALACDYFAENAESLLA